MVFGAMLLFIYNLTRIFYEKLLSLCQNQGAERQKQEVAISHNCKAQLIPLFYPQLRNYLIIRDVYFLHRQVSWKAAHNCINLIGCNWFPIFADMQSLAVDHICNLFRSHSSVGFVFLLARHNTSELDSAPLVRQFCLAKQ